MPSTGFWESTFSVAAIGSRTNSSGAAVTDYSAEEARLPAFIFEPGYVDPTNAFVVRQNTTPGMSIRVGSGAAKTDVYVVAGTVAGQGNYIVRLDPASAPNLAITAAHPSLARIDEIYLVIYDNDYDASSRSLPRIGYRTGDNGGGNPGPDSNWKAYELLARINIPGGSTAITDSMITDERQPTSIKTALYQGSTDGFYFTKSEISTLLAGKSSTSHGHDPTASVMTGSDRAHARFHSSSQQEIADHVAVRVAFGSLGAGNDLVGWTSQSGGHFFTLNAAGIWAITSTVRFKRQNGVAGERLARLVSDNYGSQQVINADGGFSTGAPVTCALAYNGYFPAGSFVFVEAYQDCDEHLSLEGDIAYQNIQLTLLRRCS